MVAKRNDIIDPKKPVRVETQIEGLKEEAKLLKNPTSKKVVKEVSELKEEDDVKS